MNETGCGSGTRTGGKVTIATRNRSSMANSGLLVITRVIAMSRRVAALAAALIVVVSTLGVAKAGDWTTNFTGDLVARRATSSAWYSSHDVIFASRGDVDGYHIYRAREDTLWAWEPLATIRPLAASEDSWVGYQCVTGSGDYVVVVVAPRRFVNSPLLRDRGAFAYAVNTRSGKVTPLLSGVALKYFNPGCGAADQVALISHLGRHQPGSEIVIIDARSGRIGARFGVGDQVVSAVPVDGGVIGTRGNSLLEINEDGARLIGRVAGQPYSLTPTDAGVFFLVATDSDRDRAQLWRLGRRLQQIGEGRLGRIKLFEGRAGRAVVVNAESIASSARAELTRVAVEGSHSLRGASLGGRVIWVAPPRTDDDSEPFVLIRSRDGSAFNPSLPVAGGTVSVELPPSLPVVSVHRLPRLPEVSPLPLTSRAATSSASSTESAAYVSLNAADEDADGNGAPARCAVPRNHDRRQVPQPDASQIDWAIQMATRNLLNGENSRPANYLNMGLAAYSPSSDFPRRQLQGTSSSSVPIPPSVIQGTFAQESAWRHASFRALPGVAGNPLVSDYYGSEGTLEKVDYGNADCGYGVSQVTSPMTKAARAYSQNGKTKVAVDYAENVAAATQFLVDTWNDLYDAGIVMNDADPRYLENWYFAFWAYNTGLHPDTGSGPWGLGWTNNPMNSDYPPDRDPFLRNTYADAEHPSDWPYQERVIGWMETPLLDYKGKQSYERPKPKGTTSSRYLMIPPRDAFCTPENECDPAYEDPDSDKDYCTRADRKCWWHWPYTMTTDCASNCGESIFTFTTDSREPSGDNNYPSRCNSTLPDSTVIVDDIPDPSLNVEGCKSTNWVTQGRFEITLGKQSDGPHAGDMVGLIDWHQLGAGFGGHTWFTKNRSSPDDTAHINTGTWIPPDLDGLYNVKAHIPSTGASTSTARYRIALGNGDVVTRVVDQHWHENTWVSLGNFRLRPGASVRLSNLTDDVTPYTTNVAFDAMAFVPVSGDAVSKRVDSVLIFDPYQRLDTDPSQWDTGSHPLQNMKTIYNWSHGVASDVIGWPRCHNSLGSPTTTTCVGDESFSAYARWLAQIEAAGDGSGAAFDAETLGTTQSEWLGFANDRLGAALTAGDLATAGSYKHHIRTRVDFLVEGGKVVPGSVALSGINRAGDTHMADFVLEIMRAYEKDYGIPPPNLQYSAEDLHLHNHTSSTANPGEDGVLPGRAYMDHRKYQLTADSECVRVKAVGGGVIGYRPMIAQEYIRTRVDAWREKIRQVVASGRAPNAILRGAEEIEKIFFNELTITNAFREEGSLFYLAPPIWTQQHFLACADGGVRAGDIRISDSSWMPDLYVFVDKAAVNAEGNIAACSGRGCSIAKGNFVNFGHPPFWPYTYDHHPWGFCDFVNDHRRNHNPWELKALVNEADYIPSKVKYCDESEAFDAGPDG